MMGQNMSDLEIRSMSKLKFKKEAAFKYLLSLKGGYSKLDVLDYSNFEKASYLNRPLFSREDVRLLLGLRSRTVNGIRNDLRGAERWTHCNTYWNVQSSSYTTQTACCHMETLHTRIYSQAI